MRLCILSGQSRYDKLSVCRNHSLPLYFLSALLYSLDSSVLILNSCFYHHYITLLCILLLSLKCSSFNSSASNLPLSPDFLSLNCSYSYSYVTFFLPLLSFLYAGHHGCGWSSTTVQERAKKEEERDTMNSNLSAAEDEEKCFFFCLGPCIALIAQQDYA